MSVKNQKIFNVYVDKLIICIYYFSSRGNLLLVRQRTFLESISTNDRFDNIFYL